MEFLFSQQPQVYLASCCCKPLPARGKGPATWRESARTRGGAMGGSLQAQSSVRFARRARCWCQVQRCWRQHSGSVQATSTPRTVPSSWLLFTLNSRILVGSLLGSEPLNWLLSAQERSVVLRQNLQAAVRQTGACYCHAAPSTCAPSPFSGRHGTLPSPRAFLT